MKNLKKLNRKELQTLQGAGPATCTGCPKNTTYGNNPGDAPCEAFQMLPDRCKMCVIVDMSCVDGGVS
ncbi:bacteriocin-like protein [Chryseobacterium sp. KCF3-3]|uniref:bacteriocin-like protein n=1 Tax=Chryseobacterium sp. KCF3-3 TaxID=3231511 RepID=UPI000554FC1F